jgi:ATP-dependent Zn protease
MQQQSFDIPLHDIKPLVEVPDNSFILFMALVVVAALFIVAVIYLLVLFWKRRKKENSRKEAFAALKNIDFKDAKQSAYAITKYGLIFADDAPRNKEAYENLINRLAPYKYKKSVDDIDDECKSYYKIYLGMIDV